MKTWTRESDKAELPPGRWQDEPDKAVWVDEATGLDCMVNRNPMGAWCGYVGVGPDHRLHGKDYSECPKGCDERFCEHTPECVFRVHGGLTYAAECQEGKPPEEGICHVPEPGRPADVWWFGFDCAHAGDLSPGIAMLTLPLAGPRGDTYKDFDYVRSEAESLARQLAKY